MTRREEANRLATRAYNAAVEIVNNAPDMGIALAALSQVSRWMQAECDSIMITENKTFANIVFEGDER